MESTLRASTKSPTVTLTARISHVLKISRQIASMLLRFNCVATGVPPRKAHRINDTCSNQMLYKKEPNLHQTAISSFPSHFASLPCGIISTVASLDLSFFFFFHFVRWEEAERGRDGTLTPRTNRAVGPCGAPTCEAAASHGAINIRPSNANLPSLLRVTQR